MKILAVISVLCCLLAAGCGDAITPSETITTETYEFATITALEASDDFEVFYTHGPGAQTIEVEANLNLQEKVRIDENNGRLKISLQDLITIRGNDQTLILRLHTTAPVNDFEARSDAEINVQTPLTVNNLFLRAASDGIIRATLNDAENVEIEARSDGKLLLLGQADRVEADLRSDGGLSGFELLVNHLKIELASDARADLTVLETLDAKANSDARLRYQGDPEILRLETNSDGRIERVE